MNIKNEKYLAIFVCYDLLSVMLVDQTIHKQFMKVLNSVNFRSARNGIRNLHL